ncbi:ATP-binding protein [Segatella copri]|nr:ATP-binding protein [Segatella copri]MCW4095543.1 ATP-binding protein [Segatella copri]MQP18610.1 AAA family ATPase [Segatella copri DSM 18205]UEA42364.1 ATP-binding protein [Segatella copri DSM 18205]UWP53027.1 ATP-binding protein [Segatella copri DSM 18205]
MVETNDRILPVGIQSFEKIRKEGYLYVDKTDIIWQLANKNKTYNYLSRPRRFGKSVLIDTLEAYFMGKKELFEGLKIMQLETEWVKRPVIRLDMSRAGAEPETLRSYLDNTFDRLEKEYGIPPNPTAKLADRFNAIIVGAYEQTGQQVAILIDEYDSPLQHSWKTPYHEACTAVYREVFAILKADDKYEKFVFITGITKFTQLSLFSVLNNLSNISFEPEYAAICGITKEEVLRDFKPEINKLAEYEDWTFNEAVAKLTAYYDGYHFSRRNMVDVFNPFSLINALADSDLKNYWASSGATSLLPKFVDDMEIRLKDFDHSALLDTIIETSDVTGGGAELFLYQSGYLTIKGYINGTYLLGIPNFEVRQALNEIVLPTLAMRKNNDLQSTQAFLNVHLSLGNLPEAMKCLKALIADVPYSNKKLASMDMEERYRLIMSTIFYAIGCRVEVEKMIATGRIDMVVENTNFIYVLELKLSNNGGVDAATEQMKAKQYAEPFKADKRKVIALAIELDDMGKGLVDWKEV